MNRSQCQPPPRHSFTQEPQSHGSNPRSLAHCEPCSEQSDRRLEAQVCNILIPLLQPGCLQEWDVSVYVTDVTKSRFTWWKTAFPTNLSNILPEQVLSSLAMLVLNSPAGASHPSQSMLQSVSWLALTHKPRTSGTQLTPRPTLQSGTGSSSVLSGGFCPFSAAACSCSQKAGAVSIWQQNSVGGADPRDGWTKHLPLWQKCCNVLHF